MTYSFMSSTVITSLIMVLLSTSCFAQRTLPITRPLLWNVQNLERIRNDVNNYKRTYKQITKIADSYCNMLPVVLTDKDKTFAPDNHYYCSVGGYWWPDSLQEGKYVHKDGVRNSWTKKYDANRLSELKNRCIYLSAAYYLTGDKKYYSSYIRQIKAWFIDEDTYMYPNFEYAAVVPGKNKGKGRTSGMIQAYSFVDVIESLLLINICTQVERDVLLPVQKWFMDFVKWSEDGRFGTALRKANNNIGLAYDVMLTEMYLFVGNEDKAKAIVDNFAKCRLNTQIDKEGKQEAELKRSKAFSYSLFNLSHVLDFCFITKYWDLDFYRANQEVIDKAYSFLQKYENNQQLFPYQQIVEWSNCQQRLKSQLMRRERLRGNATNLFVNEGEALSLNALLN